MSRVVRFDALRLRTRQLANVENDPSVTEAEVGALVNLYLTTLYDPLVAAGPPDYYAQSVDIPIVAGTIAYPLATYAPDFLSLTKVFAQESSSLRRPIDPLNDSDRQAFQAPTGNWTVTMEYVPSCPTLTFDDDTFDGVDGWDMLITASAARDLLVKRQGDVTTVMGMIASMERRIRSASTQRDRGGPKMILDIETAYAWPRSVQIDGYRLRAGNIEFYTSVWGWP